MHAFRCNDKVFFRIECLKLTYKKLRQLRITMEYKPNVFSCIWIPMGEVPNRFRYCYFSFQLILCLLREDYLILRFNNFSSPIDRKSTRLNSSHVRISYAVFCLKKKKILI